jgi:hypothetical protein
MSAPATKIAPNDVSSSYSYGGLAPTSNKMTNLPMPNLSGQANGPIGNLLKGPVDANGNLKDAALMVGIKMDLEAEVHLTARVRGDILVGLY